MDGKSARHTEAPKHNEPVANLQSQSQVQTKQSVGQPFAQAPEVNREEKIDLGEMIARGAPTQAQNQNQVRREFSQNSSPNSSKPQQTQTPQSAPEQTSIAKTKQESKGGEKCELCRAEFTLHVSGGNPKYGHCFCGAAYHRDCYDSVLLDAKTCARCGRQLELILDRKSIESLKSIKNAFE